MYFLLDVCRLCLSYKNEFYDLCSDDIMEKLVTCISDLEFEDHVPSVICDKCLEQVDLYYEFRNKCLRSEFIINNYVEKLLGGNKNSQLRSKLQVKLGKNFSPSKFPSNVKLPLSTLLDDASMYTDMNKTDVEDSKLDNVHMDITEHVKLRKRYHAKRILSVETENDEIEQNTSVHKNNSQNEIDNIPVDAVQEVNRLVDVNTIEHSTAPLTTENLGKNLSSGLNSSVIISTSEESNASVVSSIIAEPFEKSSLSTSHLPSTQISIQDKNCHLQASVNSNQELTVPLLLSVNLERKLSNQPDNLNSNVIQEDCNKLLVNLDQNQTYFHEAPVSLNPNIEEPNMNDDISVTNEEPPVYEIDDEDDDPPDEINQMMLLETLLSTEQPQSKSRAFKSSIRSKRKYAQLTSNNHISVTEHNYSGHIYLPNQKRFKVTTGPTIDCSSSSSDEIDVEGVSENEEITYLDENVIKCIKERNRRITLRAYLKDLVCALPPNMQMMRRSRVAILNASAYYIQSLEKEALKNIDEVKSLNEQNVQLKERLNELMKQ